MATRHSGKAAKAASHVTETYSDSRNLWLQMYRNSSKWQKLKQALTRQEEGKQQPKDDDATAAALENKRAAVATQEHKLHCAKLDLQKAKRAAQKRLYLKRNLPLAPPAPSVYKLDEGKCSLAGNNSRHAALVI